MNDTSPSTQLLAVLLFLLACLSLNAQNARCFGVDDTAPESDTAIGFPKDAISPEQNLYVVKPNWSLTVPLQGMAFSPIFFAEPKMKWYDFSTYKFRGEGKRAVWISYAVAGILHGGREAYHAEPTVFEKRFNVAPLSFFGSEQWKRNYYDRNPELPHKPNLFNPVRDYYHFSHLASSTIWVGGAFTIGMSKQPTKYKLLDLLIGTLITSGTASLTYNILR